MKPSCSDRPSGRQLSAIAFVGVLSPMVRRYPRDLARAAGRCGWLCPLLAAPFAALLLLLLGRLFRKGSAGLPRRMEELLGRLPARLLSGLLCLWLLFYSGFLLRAGAMRVVSAAYMESDPGVFLVLMALACGWSASGGMRAVGRSAAVLRPLLTAVLLCLPLLALRDLDFGVLVPVTAEDLAPALGGGLGLVNQLAGAALPALVAGSDREGPPRLGTWAGWGAALLALLTGITAACLGFFGPTLTAGFRYPLFMLARDMTVFGSLERMEALLVALWVLSDFIILSALLRAATLAGAFALAPDRREPVGKLPVWSAAGAALAVGLMLPEAAGSFALISERAVPAAGAAVCLGIPLLTLGAGALRKRI